MTRKQAPEPSTPIANLQKVVKGAIHKADVASQGEKFEKAARQHGADGDEDAFKGVLRKLTAKPQELK